MGLFNRSDTEEKLRAIEVVLEQLAENAASQQKFNEASAAYVDGNDKKIAHLKKMIDLLIEDNRKLKEMVIKNDERYIETLESIKKLNDTFQARLAERTKLNQNFSQTSRLFQTISTGHLGSASRKAS